MKFYAHTATRPAGRPDPDQSRWQPLTVRLGNVADKAGTSQSFFAKNNHPNLRVEKGVNNYAGGLNAAGFQPTPNYAERSVQ